jgi:dipeptide/tripeptide permease
MNDQTTAPDPPSPKLGEQLRSFPVTFWWANWIEVVERFAYYGLRTVVPIYMVLSFEEGGPQLSHEQKGIIFAVWALVQSFVPIFTGGFADRYGYKLNIAISTVVKILGYLVMGWAIEIAAAFNGESMAEMGGAAGGSYTYPIFFTGAILLAAGTAIFKPGVQGLIATSMPKGTGSFGWGIFYQMVNIGGFIGPLIAAVLQLMSWKMVFVMCSIGIALNFIPLFFFAEPKRKEGEGYTGKDAKHVFVDTLVEFVKPRVLFFTLAFAGFWLMFYQLFDILPNFIDDWVDSTAIVAALQSVLPVSMVPAYENGNLNQAWMINLDAMMIMFFAFLFGYLTGKFKSLPVMVTGIFLSAVTIYMLGMSMNGWWTLFAIGLFAIGEMVASPTKLRYMNEIAPKGKEGLFLGFANATTGIGWFVGSLLAGSLYESGGDKVNLSLQELMKDRERPAVVAMLTPEEMEAGWIAEVGEDVPAAEALPGSILEEAASIEAADGKEAADEFVGDMFKRSRVFSMVAAEEGLSDEEFKQYLWDEYEPYSMWLIFALIGVGSGVLLMIYDYVVRRVDAKAMLQS